MKFCVWLLLFSADIIHHFEENTQSSIICSCSQTHFLSRYYSPCREMLPEVQGLAAEMLRMRYLC